MLSQDHFLADAPIGRVVAKLADALEAQAVEVAAAVNALTEQVEALAEQLQDVGVAAGVPQDPGF